MRVFLILALQFLSLYSNPNEEQFDEVDSLIGIYQGLERFRVYDKQIQYAKREVAGLNNFIESSSPLILPLADITRVQIHPSRSLSIVLPTHTRVIEANTFPVSQAISRKDFNSFDIASTKELVGGEITVRYTVHNDMRDIRIMKIGLERYENNKDGKNIYYPIIKYTMKQKEKFEFHTLIEEYYRLKGKYPNGTVFFFYRGVGVGLIEDNINGAHSLGDKKYRIVSR